MATVRDETGKFVKGTAAGPGRSPKDREIRYAEITMSTVTFEHWKMIIEKARDQALAGDHTARKFLSDYLVGPPTQKHEVSTEGNMLLSVASAVDILQQAEKELQENDGK